MQLLDRIWFETHPKEEPRSELTEELEVQASKAGVQLMTHEEIIEKVAYTNENIFINW